MENHRGGETFMLFPYFFPRPRSVPPIFFSLESPLDITCNLARHCGLPSLLEKEYLSFQLELNFLFSSETSLLTLIFC